MVAFEAFHGDVYGLQLGCFTESYVRAQYQYFMTTAKNADFGPHSAQSILFSLPLDVFSLPQGLKSVNSYTRHQYQQLLSPEGFR